MNIIVAIRNRILELINERDISINKLANLSGVSPTSIKNIINGNSKKPRLTTIKKLCDGLGITLYEFFSTDEFNNQNKR